MVVFFGDHHETQTIVQSVQGTSSLMVVRTFSHHEFSVEELRDERIPDLSGKSLQIVVPLGL